MGGAQALPLPLLPPKGPPRYPPPPVPPPSGCPAQDAKGLKPGRCRLWSCPRCWSLSHALSPARPPRHVSPPGLPALPRGGARPLPRPLPPPGAGQHEAGPGGPDTGVQPSGDAAAAATAAAVVAGAARIGTLAGAGAAVAMALSAVGGGPGGGALPQPPPALSSSWPALGPRRRSVWYIYR